ncbi:MAG: sigma factor [Paracoccus sp. (in: a-proteobacteria)]|nr:sigma factor [Paracoccus sp. (in: a-proteobacteria)]
MQENRRAAAEHLIPQIADGDRGAFDSLYRLTADWLHALCLSVLNDRQQAEVAVQAVFQRIWTDAGQQKASGLSALAWLVVVTRAQAMTGAAPVLSPGESVPVRPGPLRETLAALPVPAAAALITAAQKGMAADDDALLDAAILAIAAPPEDQAADEVAAARVALNLPATAAQPDPAFAARVRGWQERIAVIAGDVTPVLVPARAKLNLDRALGHAQPSDMGDIVIKGRGRPSGDREGGGWFWIILLAVLLIGGAVIVFWPRIAP